MLGGATCVLRGLKDRPCAWGGGKGTKSTPGAMKIGIKDPAKLEEQKAKGRDHEKPTFIRPPKS